MNNYHDLVVAIADVTALTGVALTPVLGSVKGVLFTTNLGVSFGWSGWITIFIDEEVEGDERVDSLVWVAMRVFKGAGFGVKFEGEQEW